MITVSMIYDHTCAVTGHTFSCEMHTLCASDYLFLLSYLNNFDNETEGTSIINSFIEYICYDSKDIDVNH